MENKVKSNLKYLVTLENSNLCILKILNVQLDFGDYAVGGDDYDYAYVDRKEQDFKSV